MHLQTPDASPYDLSFPLFGFSIRVTWTFWLVAALLGYTNAQSTDMLFAQTGRDTPGMAGLLVIWMAVMFVSILIHELGHTIAFRLFGVDSHIVLYHFGGMAIPESFTSFRGARNRRIGAAEQLVVSAAGPAAQLVLGSIVAGISIAFGYEPGLLLPMLRWIGIGIDLDLQSPDNAAIYALIGNLIYINFAWAILNLLPILPMDGGRIAQSLIALAKKNDGLYEASVVSIVVGAVLGMWLWKFGNGSLGIMLIVLGLSNLENIQRPGTRW